jgi:hypothetical protein
MRFLPGKMAEGKQLVEEMLSTIIAKEYGPFPSVRKYSPWIGGGNAVNTIILEVEWESLAQMTEFLEKAQTDPDMMKTAPQWAAVEESHIIELYGVLP